MSRSRARAIALARRKPDPLPWLPWLLLLSLLIAGAALAQPAPQSDSPVLPPSAQPPAMPPGAQPSPLPIPRSEHPDVPGGTTRNGVATPSVNADPGIVAPTPSRPDAMPTAPTPAAPPGTTVIPK